MGVTGTRRHAGLLFMLAAFISLGLLYSWATPVLEGGDEVFHYPLIRHIALTGQIPSQAPKQKNDWAQEGSQPPLYHVLMAALTGWVDTSDYNDIYHLNPHAKIGRPGELQNKNMVVHYPEREAFPWRGTVLAIQLIRVASILLAAIAVALTYFSALLLFPGRRNLALAASALHSFNPMYLYVTSTVHNDTLATTISSLALYLTLRCIRPGAQAGWRGYLALGVTLGVGALTRLSVLTILPSVGLAVLGQTWRCRAWRPLWRGVLGIGGPMLLLSGWWFLRNWQLYSDPTGMDMMARVAGTRPPGFGWADLPAEWEGFVWSYWGVFGGFTVLASLWFYDAINQFATLCLVGLLLYVVSGLRLKEWQVWPMLLMALWVLVALGAVARWSTMTYASQGRLLFSALSAEALLLATGLSAIGGVVEKALSVVWVRASRLDRVGGVASGLVALSLAGLAAFIAIHDVHPVYVAPPQREIAEVGSIPNPVTVRYGGSLELIGYSLDRDIVKVGEKLRVTLYWRCLKPVEGDYSIYAHVVDGRPEEKLGLEDSYPDGGRLSTRQLEPGKVLIDWRDILIERPPVNGPRGDLLVGLYDSRTGTRLPATNAAGETLDRVLLGSVWVVSPPQLPGGAVARAATYGDVLALEGYRLEQPVPQAGRPLKLTLYWHALKRIDKDYSVFVHLTGPTGKPLAQNDHQPRGGNHPTSQWKDGEWVVDGFTLELGTGLAPGPYELRVGLYDLKTMGRLPVALAGGGANADFITIPVDVAPQTE